MVGAAIAVLAEGAPEFADQHHHRVLPCGTLLVGEGGEPAPQFLEPGGEEAARAALADVRVPAAHVDKADVELLLHQLRKDRKSTRLNSSHGYISYAVFCLKK